MHHAVPSAAVGGTIALVGGGPFRANDDLDRRLVGTAHADRVVVLPTADAFEAPGELVAAAMSWGERLDVQIEALMVMQRQDAEVSGAAEVVRAARAIYVVGDSSMHLRSVLKETAVFAALTDVLGSGGLIVAVGSCAAAVCDPMLDQRGGAFTLGLGLVRGMAVIPEAETWSEERLQRTLSLADTPVVELPTGSAVVGHDGGWEFAGRPPPTAHGELTAITTP
jgi:cyanophycinase